MAFRRDVPLIPTLERFVQLVPLADLRNLEASGELSLEELLRSASATVYDMVRAGGVPPELVLNPQIYEKAVASQVLGLLAEAGHLGDQDAQVHFARVEQHLAVHPELAEGDAPRVTVEGIPAVQNPSDPPFLGAFGRGT